MKTEKQIKLKIKGLKKFIKKHHNYKTQKDIMALSWVETRLQMLEWVLD